MRNVSLELGPGERVSVIGTNGAGKSTLFNCIAGALPVTSGRITLFGEEITKMRAARRARRGLARTFQTSRLFGQLTAAENLFVALGGVRMRGSRFIPSRLNSGRWKAAAELLERVGLAGRGQQLVADLSHGEQRQLEIGMALALDPKILMLDEPAAGFSPSERAHLVELLRTLPDTVSLLLIEHDMDIALAAATRVIVMHDGEKILEGTPDEIRESELVRAIYLGGMVGDAAH
jgi:branched-chain amino acid transport system ATP-binding protein